MLGRVDELRDSDVCGNNVEKGNESLGKLLVASGNWSELFDTVNESLHSVALFVEFLVIIDFLDAILLGPNDDLHLVICELFANLIAIVTLIHHGVLNRMIHRYTVKNGIKPLDIGGLSLGNNYGDDILFA